VAVIRRLVHGVWSLGWLAIVLVGVPVALVHYLGWPFPDHWPTRPEWEGWVAQPLTRPALLGTFAVLVWLMWAGLVYALIVEIVTRGRRLAGWLRGRSLPPLPTPMQATASGMLGAAVFGMPTGTAGPSVPVVAAPPLPAPAATAVDPSPAAAVPADAPPVGSSGDRHGPAAGRLVPAKTGVMPPDGGWVTDQTAAAVASAAALVWLQRRRRYRPRPPGGAERDDADLAPLPDTVAALQSGRHPDTDDDGGDEAGRGDDRDAAVAESADAAAVHPAVVGHRAGAPVQPGDLPAGGVGLTGDGAPAAARGILTATLLSGDPWHPDGDARLVTTAADLAAVLDGGADAHHATPGLTVAATLHDALTVVEQAAMARTASAPHRPATGGPAADDGGPAGTPFPPIVLLTGSPAEPADARRLAVILTLGTHLGIAGVLLGRWEHGATWHVDADGASQPVDQPTTAGARLCVLTAAATADLLAMLREARANRQPPHRSPPSLPGPRSGQAGPASAAAAERRPNAPTATPSALTNRPAVTPLRAQLLGRPAIHRGDGTPIPIRRTAALQVLTFLAVHRAGATSNQLIAALWPGPRPHAAAGRLYTPVSELRITLQEAAGADVLVRVGDRYLLDARHIDVDLWRLQAAVNAAAAAAADPGGRADALRRVVAGYTGELAAGGRWPWLAAPREAIRRQVIDACVALAAAEPDPRASVALLDDALRVDPVNDELRRLADRARAAADHPGPGPAR
jgi:DNA-binding SARP family transcriptional activator